MFAVGLSRLPLLDYILDKGGDNNLGRLSVEPVPVAPADNSQHRFLVLATRIDPDVRKGAPKQAGGMSLALCDQRHPRPFFQPEHSPDSPAKEFLRKTCR